MRVCEKLENCVQVSESVAQDCSSHTCALFQLLTFVALILSHPPAQKQLLLAAFELTGSPEPLPDQFSLLETVISGELSV